MDLHSHILTLPYFVCYLLIITKQVYSFFLSFSVKLSSNFERNCLATYYRFNQCANSIIFLYFTKQCSNHLNEVHKKAAESTFHWKWLVHTHYSYLHAASLYFFENLERVVWWLATCARKPKVPGSNPTASYVQM